MKHLASSATHRLETQLAAAAANHRITSIAHLAEAALQTGRQIGKVKVLMGNTACKVPFAPEYIEKVVQRGSVGKKKKMARC